MRVGDVIVIVIVNNYSNYESSLHFGFPSIFQVRSQKPELSKSS